MDDVTFQVNKGETVAVVGESGCGKSTLAMTVLGLETATAGEIVVEGDRLGDVSRVVADRLGRDVGIVFQNPLSALNPKMKVAAIVGEPLKTALGLRGKDLHERVALLLEEVGLRPEHMRRYPHEFSGGQCQRICIARALALKPKLLILDEPTAALDVSVQAQILKLLNELQRELGVSYLFITHDLGTVDYIADRVLVMYLGKIVENGPVAQVFSAPAHPYTRALLDSVPTLDPAQRGALKIISGEVPSPVNRPPGCAFAPRCPRAEGRCRQEVPLSTARDGIREVACFHPLIGETPDQRSVHESENNLVRITGDGR
ncbi:MAG TPA: oligopeptide/dipeptide ABC transporter ATP-binding protein [Pseudomonadales bacterium]|nr:oligopeptide/dipeptide ABC transporter ATP-binding protein [Pseudomonadales bacterium]